MTIEHHVEQYSDDWYRLRIGIPTASEFHHILTPLGVPTRGDRRKKYMFKLIAERLIQQSMANSLPFYWLKRAKELEPDAANSFAAQFAHSRRLDRCGFFTTNDKRVGASPDRMLRHASGNIPDEGVEIKCPSPWVQVEYLLDGPDNNYTPQVQGQMLVTGVRTWHLWCYHPNMPGVHVLTVRDDLYCEKLARELFAFCNELDVETDRARRIGPYKLAELLRLSVEMADDTTGFAGLDV